MARLVAQRDRQAVKTGGVGRQTKSQEVIGPVETSAPDMPSRQRGVQLPGMGMPGKPEQWRASGNRKARFRQDLVKLVGLLFKLAARVIGPWLIAERRRTDQQRGPGTRPWTQCPGDTLDHIRRGYRESQPQSGKAIEFPERAQDHYRPIGAQCDRADGRIDIGECFIDDKPSTTAFQLRCNPRQRGAIGDAAIGIVGIDDDRVDGTCRGKLRDCRSRSPDAPHCARRAHVRYRSVRRSLPARAPPDRAAIGSAPASRRPPRCRHHQARHRFFARHPATPAFQRATANAAKRFPADVAGLATARG